MLIEETGLKSAGLIAPPKGSEVLTENMWEILNSHIFGVVVVQDEYPCFANQAFVELLKLSPDVGHLNTIPIWSLVHPDDLPLVRDNHGRRMTDQDVVGNYDFRLVRTDKKTIWVNCHAEKIKWLGRPATLCLITDITAVRKEKQENSSEKLFQNIFNLSPDVMVIANLDMTEVKDVNPSFLNVFGCRRDNVIGKSVADLNICADLTFLDRFRHEVKMTASMMDMPTTLTVRGGLVRYFRLFAHKVEHAAESSVLLMAKDVTDDMTQTQELERSRDSAELANRAKSEFLANMSHELRTPLNAILGFAEVIQNEIMGPLGNIKYQEYATDIHESGTHLLAIINDILDLSKVEAGRINSHLMKVDVVPALQNCTDMMQQRALDANITIEENYSEGLEFEADERLIKQIGLNLLSNAIKFTESGGRVTISLSKVHGDDICLCVEDTGIGMTPEEVKIARRPFGQIHSPLASKHQGSGLGLSLVASFVSSMNGMMRILSVPAEGTKVSLYFPAPIDQ